MQVVLKKCNGVFDNLYSNYFNFFVPLKAVVIDSLIIEDRFLRDSLGNCVECSNAS